MPKKIPFEERFWEKVDKCGEDECWNWKGYRNHHGYGQFGVSGKVLYAHRVSWELANGPIPEGMCVLHHCDNPSCVNPAHLFLGTHTDNMHDMIAKGRDKHNMSPRGENHGRAKLSENDVHQARQWMNEGRRQGEIAKELGVSYGTISKIKRRVHWGWLK